MSIINSQPLIGASGQSTGYTLSKSLRFRAGANAYLSRTPASAGNQQKWTYSAWLKLGNLAANGMTILSGGTSSRVALYLNTSAQLVTDVAGVGTFDTSSAVYRDPAAWYHLVWQFDTTQATAANRSRMYINGSQITLTQLNAWALNTNYNINNGTLQTIGTFANATTVYLYDGYMANVQFIDGSSLTPSSFGETNATTGAWQPKAYTGSYGTNGFYLPFTDATSTSTLGNDSSGNSNTWTTNNISVTAGVTYDSMTDVPTLTSATAANYAVGNPLSVGANTALTNGNLAGTLTGAGGWSGTICGLTSGKWYYEATITATTINSMWIGFLSDAYTKNDNAWSFSTQTALYANDARNGNNVLYGASYTTNDVIGVAIDLSTSSGSITFYKNNVSQGVMFSSLTTSAIWRPLISGGGTGSTIAMNFGQQGFTYTPPSGFVALNTYNL